jgi:hypothetical protein
MPDNTQQSLLDMARELPVETNYLDLVREVGREQRQETAPGGMEAQAAGETAGAMLSSGLTPFGFQRGAEALSVVMAKLFGDEGTGQLAEQIYRADDKNLQAGGGIRDTVGRSLAGMTAATVRGAATTIEAVVPDAVDPMAKVEGFTRGMANTAAVTSDTFTDKVTAAVTNGVANIALGVAAPMAAPALFFLQGAGGAANEYDQAYIDGMLTSKDGLYKPGDKYISALKGGVIEGATEWLGAKTAKAIGASVWGKGAIKSIEKMNPAMKFAVGTGLAYASEAAEEGGASIAYSLTKNWQGQERPEFWDGAKEAFADAFYGGFGGAGAHPLIAVGEAAQAKRMRNRISAEIARSNNAFSDPDFWEAMPKATVDAMRAMSPQERQAELSSARDAYHQSNADRQAGAAALNSAASALDNAQKELSRANKRGKQDAIDAATKNVEAAQAGFDSAFSNQSILGAELLSARTRLMTIAAFNARNTPTITRNTTDVLAAEKLSVAAPTSDTDSKVQSEMESLGYDVQFFDPTDPNDTRPAFYNPATPNTVYLRSGMKESEFAAAMGYAYHEVIHVIQATDGDLYKALRQSFDEQSTVEAGVQYFNDKLRADDRLAQTAAGTIAAEVGGVGARPMMQGQMVEERAGRALLQAEGEAQITQSAMEEFFKTGKAPGLLGRVIIKLGLRGKQAATALRVRSVLMKGAQERIARKAAPAKVGSEVALTEFGRQIEEAKGVVGAVQMAETAPAPAAPSTTAAAPAAAAAAPSAAPVPPSASAAALTASGMTPAEAARAETPDFKAMVNLAVNNIRKGDKTFAQGKRLYPIMAAMESDPSTLSDDDRQIGRQMQQEMYAEFGPKYASLWARQSKPRETATTPGRALVRKAIEVLGLTEQEISSTVIDLMTGNPGRNAFQKNDVGRLPAVVKFLHDRRLQSGLKVLDINSEDDRETISRLLAAEAIGAINSAGSALEWYDSTIRNTLAQAALKYPELDSDPRARLAFLLTMAISSQGLNVESNLNFTMRQYGEYRNTVDPATGIGQFRQIGEGKHSGAQANNFRIANSMIKSIGPDQMIQFLRTSFTAKELTDAGLEIGGELKSERVLGSAIFGPKIGFGFYSNLDGNFDPVTMDMWFMRTIGRLSGTLPAFERGKFDKQVARLRAGLTQRGSNGIFPSALDPAMVERAKNDSLGDAPVIELARTVAKLHERDFVENRAQYDNKTRVQSQIVLASKSIVQSLDKPRDSPKSGGERRALRDVVRRAVQKVSDIYGKDVANAAFQALIWYPEQELYRALGVRLKVTSQDYSGAIRKLLKTEGFNDGQLDGAIATAQSRSAAARQVAGGAVAGTGGVAGAVAVPARTLTEQQRQQFLAETPVSIAKSWVAPDPAGTLNAVQSQFFKQFAAIGFVREQQRGSYAQDWRYGRSGDGDGKKPRILKVARKFEDAGKKNAKKIALPYVSVIEAGDALSTLFKRQDLLTPKFHELKSTKQTATWFHEQIMAFKASNKNGAAVEGKSVEELLAARMFVSRNGQSGFAIKPNGDIVSVFSEKGGGRAILEAAIASGGRRLDCFDTVLPVIYGAHGFKAVARMAWNDQYKPDDWDYANFQKYNNGRPDVVFMVHDPMSMAQYEPTDGPMMTEYDNGMAAQDAELAKIRPSTNARFKKITGTPSETTTSTELAKRFEQRTTGVSEPIKNLINTLNSIITGRDLAALAPTANQQAVANAAAGNYVEIYPSVRAKFMYLDETIMLSKKDVDGDGRIFAHELMHAATSVRIDDYVRRFFNEITRAPSGLIDPQLIAKYSEYNFTTKSGKAYMNGLAFMANHPKADPAMKELIDCFLEAAKSSPENYAIMTEGRMLRTGKYSYTGSNPIEVVEEQKVLKKYRFPLPGQTESNYEEVPYTQYQVVIKNETEKGDLVVGHYNNRQQADVVANELRSGKPTATLNALFPQTGTGLVAEKKMKGRGAVNQGQGGDVVTQRGGMYGFGNLHEFIAECANNPEFQNVLRKLPSKGRGGTVFTRLMNAIRQLLGLSEDKQTMLDDVMRLTEEIATVDMTAATQGRRQAVAGETAVQKTKKPSQYGFPVLNETKSIFEYSKRQQIYSITSKFPSVNLDTSNNIELQPIDLDVKVTIAFDKFAKQWLIESISTSMGDDYRIKDIAFELEQAGIRASGVVPGGKVGVANKINELSKGIADNYQNDQVTRAEAISRAQSKPIVDLRGSVASSSVSLSARPSVSPEAKADVAAVAIFDVAKTRLGTLLNSLPKDKTKWSAADVAAVKAARKEVMAAVRGLKRKPKGADVGTMAYGMGRREGQVGGMIKGRKEGMREERERQRAEAIAKRKELRTSFVARVEKLRAQIEAAAEKNDVLRQRMEMMRKMERLNRDAAAERAGKRVIKAWFAGQQKGSTAGYNEAKREMKEIRKAAAEVIGTLPRSMRGKYIDAVARMKTAAGIDQIARRVVRDLAIAEASETVGDINRLIKRVKKVGLRAETRTNLLTDLTAARSMLASGKKRLLPFTNTADLANRTAAARSLQEGVLHEFDMERQEYRDARDERAMEATADAIALGKTLAALPKIERGKLSSVAPKRGIVADILVSNSNADMYTLMQAIEGGANGILGKIWTGINAAKGSMTLARKSIDEKIDKALRDAGYNGYDGYATTAAGLYGDSAAESVSVTIGGKAMTITTDQLLNIAAMDQQTVDLLTDATDPAGDKGAPIVFSTDRNAKPMYLTKQEFDAIRAGLSTGQRNLIDTMKSILDTDIRPAAFDIHFQIHGRQPSIVPGYFPRKRLGDEISEQGIDPNMQPGAVVNTMLSNAGFLQERVAAKSTMVIGGMMRTMDDHIEESLRLIHLSLPLRHAMSVLKSAAVRTGIEETMGDGGNDSIRKLVLNGVGLSGKPQGGLIEGINANVSGALITINPKTWLRQIGGVFRLASEMPAGAWAAGVGRMIVMSPSERSKMAQSIESINGYFYDRHRRSQVGIFANVLGNANNSKDRWASALQSSARSFRAIGEDVAAGRFTQAARDVRDGVLPISRVMKSADGVLRIIDRQIMLAAFLGARADVMKTNPSMSAAEADVAAARLAEYAFRKTQNVSDPMDDTVFAARQKFSQGVGRLMFPFSSDPLKGYNQLRRAIVSRDPALIARTTAGITGNIATAAAVNPLWMTAGLAIANALGGSGDDEDDEMIRRMEMEKQYRYLGPTIAADASAVAFGYLGMAAGAMIDGAMGSPERADDVLEPLVVRFLGDTTQYIAKGQMSMGAKAALQMAGVPVVAPFSTVENVYRAANPSDSKLLEYYRKLDKAGQLNLKQRQRMNVLAAAERMRLAREKRDKVLNP